MGTEFIKLTFITRCNRVSKADLHEKTIVQITILKYQVCEIQLQRLVLMCGYWNFCNNATTIFNRK